MSRIAISGSWRTVDAQVERDVRSAIASLYMAGNGIVSGGALGVDYIATEEALKHDPVCARTLIILPTPLSVYAAHYRKRAGEGVITAAQAEALIAQLTRVQSANPLALREMPFDACNNLTYFARNSEVVNNADSLLAFQVNNSEGVGDTIAKAEARGLPVTCHRYSIAAPPTAVLHSTFRSAREAAQILALASAKQRTLALQEMAAALRRHAPAILSANETDMSAAANLTAPLRERLMLTPERLEAVASGVVAIANIPDPVGIVQTEWDRPNGLHIQRVSVPLGVIGIIYESRPNVTADAGALCVRSGNACILRGGSDSFHSSHAIHKALQEGLLKAGLPPECVQMVESTDRALVGEMLAATGLIDVIIPRGGKSLVARVEAESRVPVFAHLEGINHVYVDAEAEAAMAVQLLLNAKLRRTSVCGAAETLLVDAASPLLAPLVQALLDAGCEVRGDADTQAIDTRVRPATEDDWRTEYLDAIMSAKVVANVSEAIAHINRYGSHHTDCIVTNNAAHAEKFLREVDSAIVLHNASTQFADGGEFGFGAEIGIATGRLHARGPVGAAQLTTYKYVVKGSGQTRP